MTIKLEVVTAERVVFSGEVDSVVAPGVEGQLGILPHHTPLMTTLAPGELVMKTGDQQTSLAVTGGFLEVRPDRVIVLADTAERAEEIDVARAEAAKRRAEEHLKQRQAQGLDQAATEAALRRAMIRLKVAEKRKKKITRI